MLISNRLLMLTIFGLLVPLKLLGEVPSVLGIYPQPLSPGVRAILSVAGVGREATVLLGGQRRLFWATRKKSLQPAFSRL